MPKTPRLSSKSKKKKKKPPVFAVLLEQMLCNASVLSSKITSFAEDAR
jgi:hypothetical protein